MIYFSHNKMLSCGKLWNQFHKMMQVWKIVEDVGGFEGIRIFA